MKTLKNKILSVLLLSFAFFMVHDYFIVDNQISEYKSSHIHQFDSAEEANIHMHEAVHTIWSMNNVKSLKVEQKTPLSQPSNLPFSISSNITLVPQKPPSV
jgi:hypothetical protein